MVYLNVLKLVGNREARSHKRIQQEKSAKKVTIRIEFTAASSDFHSKTMRFNSKYSTKFIRSRHLGRKLKRTNGIKMFIIKTETGYVSAVGK